MRIKRDELLRQLTAVSPAVTSKEVIEQSNSIVFRGGKAISFNDEICCSTECCLKIEGAIKAAEFLELLRKLPEEELDIELVDGSDGKELSVKGQKRRAGIAMQAQIALPVEGVEEPGKWAKLPDDFLDAVKIVASCASSDHANYAATCIHVHPEWLEACDNFQIARFPLKTGLKTATLVRHKSLMTVAKMDMTEWSKTDNWLHFRNPAGLVMSCRRDAETKYPDLNKFLDCSGSKTPLPQGIDEMVEKAQIFSNQSDDINHVTVELKQEKMKLTGRGVNGWYSEVRSVVYSGEELKFAIDPKLLLEISKRANECVVGEGRIRVDAGKFRYVACTAKPQKKEE